MKERRRKRRRKRRRRREKGGSEKIKEKEEARTRHSAELADVTSGRRRRVQIANSQYLIER